VMSTDGLVFEVRQHHGPLKACCLLEPSACWVAMSSCSTAQQPMSYACDTLADIRQQMEYPRCALSWKQYFGLNESTVSDCEHSAIVLAWCSLPAIHLGPHLLPMPHPLPLPCRTPTLPHSHLSHPHRPPPSSLLLPVTRSARPSGKATGPLESTATKTRGLTWRTAPWQSTSLATRHCQ
jgi:hypothetical protein